MNNNPENEKIDISEIESVEENTDEVFSTVFSAPAEHKRAPKRKKHRLLVAIASVLSVAILIGGTVAVIKLIPEKEEEINYADCAEVYRNYLINEKGLTSKVTEDETNLYIDLFGGVLKTKSILGVPVSLKTEITGFMCMGIISFISTSPPAVATADI